MDIKKYIAECIGTAVLVILGCGTAMLVGCDAAAGGGNTAPIVCLWVFIVGPLAGAALAAVVYKYLRSEG